MCYMEGLFFLFLVAEFVVGKEGPEFLRIGPNFPSPGPIGVSHFTLVEISKVLLAVL